MHIKEALQNLQNITFDFFEGDNDEFSRFSQYEDFRIPADNFDGD